jgi:hypothetical protein
MDMLIKKNFDQHRDPVGINWFILLTITLFLICSGIQEAYCAEKDIQETLYVRAKINVTWNIDAGYKVNTGTLDMNLNGMLIYNKEMSSPTHGLPSVMLTYDPQNMTGFYRYREESISKKDTECPLEEEYHGSGSFSFREPSKLMVHYLGSLFKGIPLKKTKHPEDAGYLTDYYDFGIHPPELTAEGKRRYSSKCSYKPSTRRIRSHLRIRFRIKSNGEMSGSRTWTSHWSSEPPTFTIGVSDLGTPYKEKPYKPPAKEPGNVTYKVEWRIDKAPAIDIFRETEPDVFVPITNVSQEVIVGERIKLKAVVHPEDKDPKQGEWSIGSITPKSKGTYKEKKFLKDFVVNGEVGKVVELEGEELKEPEIKFHWWDEGKNIKLKYKTVVEGKGVTGESTFNVRKPAITMSADTPQGKPYCGPIKDGPDNLLYETPDKATIKFTRTEIPADFTGETQYVQLVHEIGCWIKQSDALYFSHKDEKGKEFLSHCANLNRTGLDTEYPYTKKEEALDTPGFDIGLLYDKEKTVHYKFTMYLEYKPKKEGAIFVPLRVTDWEWRGVLKWNPQTKKTTCNVTRTEKPRDRAAKEYATWNLVIKEEDKKEDKEKDKKKPSPWGPCIPEKTECR